MWVGHWQSVSDKLRLKLDLLQVWFHSAMKQQHAFRQSLWWAVINLWGQAYTDEWNVGWAGFTSAERVSHHICLMDSPSASPLALWPGESIPHPPGTFTHLQSSNSHTSHRPQQDSKSFGFRGSRKQVCVAFSLRQAVCIRWCHTQFIKRQTDSFSPAALKTKVFFKNPSNRAWTCAFAFRFHSVVVWMCCSNSGLGAINEGNPRCHCAKPRKPRAFSLIVEQAGALTANQGKSVAVVS